MFVKVEQACEKSLCSGRVVLFDNQFISHFLERCCSDRFLCSMRYVGLAKCWCVSDKHSCHPSICWYVSLIDHNFYIVLNKVKDVINIIEKPYENENWSAQVTQHQSTEFHSLLRMEAKSDTEPLTLNHNGREKLNKCCPAIILLLQYLNQSTAWQYYSISCNLIRSIA